MTYVFISYSKQNRAYVRRLSDHLEATGFDVWMDSALEPSEDWWKTIVQAIKNCAAFIVVMTPESDNSRWVQRELTLADELHKPMFPLLLDGDANLVNSDNWSIFIRTQYTDVRGDLLPGDEFLNRLGKSAQRQAQSGGNIAPASANEAQQLVESLNNPKLTPKERAEIGKRLALIGDPRPGVGLREDGLPDIEWVHITDGESMQGFVAVYPVTWLQFQSFVDDPQGYTNPEWWTFSEDSKAWRLAHSAPEQSSITFANHPRVNVTWYEASAFCIWLNTRLGLEGLHISLVPEELWYKAGVSHDQPNVYPWGNNFDPLRCNSNRSGINQLCAVGLFPQGISPMGIHDLSGNVWEWCANEYDNPAGGLALQGNKRRAMRGGAWNYDPQDLRLDNRSRDLPGNSSFDWGFRLAKYEFK